MFQAEVTVCAKTRSLKLEGWWRDIDSGRQAESVDFLWRALGTLEGFEQDWDQARTVFQEESPGCSVVSGGRR